MLFFIYPLRSDWLQNYVTINTLSIEWKTSKHFIILVFLQLFNIDISVFINYINFGSEFKYIFGIALIATYCFDFNYKAKYTIADVP